MSEVNGASAPSNGVIGSGSVGGLTAFLDFLIDRGIATASAVTPLKSAVRQVFETVEGTDNIDHIEVRSLDVDDYLDRFRVKAIGSGRYKPDSITSYRSRFQRAVAYYETYLTTGSTPKLQTRGGAGAGPKKEAKQKAAARVAPVVAEASESTPTELTNGPSTSGLISYPFPLASGGIATLRLPVRLEQVDADRLGAFIRTLVFEPQKQITMGTPATGDES